LLYPADPIAAGFMQRMGLFCWMSVAKVQRLFWTANKKRRSLVGVI